MDHFLQQEMVLGPACDSTSSLPPQQLRTQTSQQQTHTSNTKQHPAFGCIYLPTYQGP